MDRNDLADVGRSSTAVLAVSVLDEHESLQTDAGVGHCEEDLVVQLCRTDDEPRQGGQLTHGRQARRTQLSVSSAARRLFCLGTLSISTNRVAAPSCSCSFRTAFC